MRGTGFFSKDSWWSLLGGALPASMAVICLPALAILHGIESFSYVSLLCSVFFFLTVYDFGLSRSLHHFIPPLKSVVEAKSFFSSGLFIGFLLGLVAMVVCYIIAEPLVMQWLQPSQELEDDVILSFQVICLGMIPSIMISVYKGALEALSEFKTANIAKIISGTTLFLFPLLVYPLSTSFEAVAWSLVISRFVALYLYYRLSYQFCLFQFNKGGRSKFKEILNYSLYAAIAGFISTGFIFFDRFYVAGYVTNAELSIYVLSQDIMSRYLLLPWSLAIVLVPLMANSDEVKGQRQVSSDWYKKVSVLNLIFLSTLLFFIFYISPLVIPEQSSWLVLKVVSLLSIGIMAAAYSQLAVVSLFAKGKVKTLMTLFLFEGLLYLMFAPTVFQYYGVIGACTIWSVRLVLEALLLKAILTREMNLHVG